MNAVSVRIMDRRENLCNIFLKYSKNIILIISEVQVTVCMKVIDRSSHLQIQIQSVFSWDITAIIIKTLQLYKKYKQQHLRSELHHNWIHPSASIFCDEMKKIIGKWTAQEWKVKGLKQTLLYYKITELNDKKKFCCEKNILNTEKVQIRCSRGSLLHSMKKNGPTPKRRNH